MKTLSLIIPAYNEAQRLPRTLDHIAQHMIELATADVFLLEVIIVDDGSTDDTEQVVKAWPGELPIIYRSLETNQGKGAAVRAGMLAAQGDYCVFYDADAATPFSQLPRFFTAVREQSAAVVIGQRQLDDAAVVMSWHRRFIGRVYYWLTAPLIPGVTDAACGCKLFTQAAARDLFARQRLNRFAFDVEVLHLAHRAKYTIVSVPVPWTAVPQSKVRLVRDGVEMLWRVLGLYWRAMFSR